MRTIRTRICPGCSYSFKRCKMKDKIRTCPKCELGICYDGDNTLILAVKQAQIEASTSVVEILENHISKRDGLNFRFEGAERWKELNLAYSLIERAEGFLGRQIDIGLGAVEFCIEVVNEVLSDRFWAQVTKSIAMFIKYVSRFASEVFVRHKDSIQAGVRDEELSSMADFSSYGEDEVCLRPQST